MHHDHYSPFPQSPYPFGIGKTGFSRAGTRLENKLAYIESRSAEEFKKMTAPGSITDKDIEDTDIDELARQLVETEQ